VSKKRKNVVKFPVRRAGAGQDEPGRKMSEIIKEMALRLLKEPETVPSIPAVECALVLATAAWNSALGEPVLRNKHRDLLAKFDWDGASPWPELRSSDTDEMIAELVAYKKANYPDDDRRIVAAGLSPEGKVQVHWLDGEKPIAALFGSAVPKATASVAAGRRPLAEELVAKMKRHARGKVTDLRSVIAGRAAAKELQKTVATKERLADLHLTHAAYAYVQNQVSVFVEQLSALDELAALTDLVAKAEDEYLPSGPPMSPLTKSYFSFWAFFDACIGSGDETFGTTVLEVGAAFGMHSEMLRLIRLMQDSMMGVYAHEGTEGDLAVLREIGTGSVCRAMVPAGYSGQKGELWYARVLPPPIPDAVEHVVITTPYILLKPGVREWQAYLRRAVPQGSLEAYERHMKFGPTRAYWNEFVFEAYVNHRKEAVFLAGLPDVAESRPHSAVNR